MFFKLSPAHQRTLLYSIIRTNCAFLYIMIPNRARFDMVNDMHNNPIKLSTIQGINYLN